MKIGVLGLWHLGPVTAAGLASLGHQVVGIDFDEPRIVNLNKGIAPVFEPGLAELIESGLASGRLRFSSVFGDLNGIELLWVAYDTPLDDGNVRGAFAGGTLERDVAFLNRTAHERSMITPLLSAVLPSNDLHRNWAQRKLRSLFGDLTRTTVAVWGLTYKPGTDTLRRSPSIELCDWLIQEGAAVRVHDPMIKNLPHHWCGTARRCEDPLAAVEDAHALIMATQWPLYREIPAHRLLQACARLAVLDANRFLPDLAKAGLRYFAVGTPSEESWVG